MTTRPPGRPRRNIVPPNTNLSQFGVDFFDRLAREIYEKDRTLLDSLSEHERRIVIDIIAEQLADDDGNSELSAILWERDFYRKPVSIRQFVEDDYYIGRVAKNIHPRWKEDLDIVFAPGSKYTEWVMGGAIGSGKTTIAMIALCYKLYWMSCLRNPATYYGLDVTETTIVFGIYSRTKMQAADASFSKFRTNVDSSPYFRQHFPRSAKIQSQLVFNNGKLKVFPGSRGFHTIGLDMFSFVLDEANFMEVRDDADGNATGQAYELYEGAMSRAVSRFIRPGGVLPGINILISSEAGATSFLREHMKKVNREITYVTAYSQWECKDSAKFIKPWFTVELGDTLNPPRIITNREEPRPGAATVKVPGEYRDRFEANIDSAIREIAGIPTQGLNPLIRDRSSVYDAILPTLPFLFTKETISVSVGDDTRLDEYFLRSVACRVEGSKYVPRLNPRSGRFIHVDIGLTGDALGIAMSHCAGLSRGERTNPDGTISDVQNPYVVVDFVLRVTPPHGSQISLAKIRSFILYLSKIYNVIKVTFDGFQSADAVQILNRIRPDWAEVVSVDRKDDQYLALRGAFFERRIAMARYEPVIAELFDLEWDMDEHKVDHPRKASDGTKGKKDCADGLCGSVWGCLSDKRSLLEPILVDRDTVANALRRDPTVVVQKAPVPRSMPPGVSWDDLHRNLLVR